MPDHRSFEDVHVDDLLREVTRQGAVELRLTAGGPLVIEGQPTDQPFSTEILLPSQAERLCYDVLTDAQLTEYEAQGELRFLYLLPRCGQFQAHYRRSESGVEATFHCI